MKILFVDDEENIRDLFSEYFKSDYEVWLASNGEEALNIALGSHFDLIISDISLPKLNGIQFIEKLRAKEIYTPFVVITGDSDIQIAIDVFRLGAVDFFLKPFKMESLRLRIKKFENADLDTIALYKSGDAMFNEGEYKISLLPKIKNINKYVALLVQQVVANPNIQEDDLLSLKVVFYELLSNAIEHGAAGITYKEKQTFLESGKDYFQFVEERCANCNYGKLITVSTKVTEKGVTVTIEDQGDGFVLAEVPDPIQNPGANLLSGRGIFLTKMNIDEIHYNEKGNIVRVFKGWTY
ncbi:two-component system response regulator [Leptospira kobayashii]|uniref:Two-component system response regulator n=1 Tax=Leptospira kobayashii TaxID=1917830 RepID=A0ABN6KJR5_9LEPT|nr:response regulator [Leptospira kobayashii]BDA80416.1 two-component system response regulator [Leptospira kobayashii]